MSSLPTLFSFSSPRLSSSPFPINLLSSSSSSLRHLFDRARNKAWKTGEPALNTAETTPIEPNGIAKTTTGTRTTTHRTIAASAVVYEYPRNRGTARGAVDGLVTGRGGRVLFVGQSSKEGSGDVGRLGGVGWLRCASQAAASKETTAALGAKGGGGKGKQLEQGGSKKQREEERGATIQHPTTTASTNNNTNGLEDRTADITSSYTNTTATIAGGEGAMLCNISASVTDSSSSFPSPSSSSSSTSESDSSPGPSPPSSPSKSSATTISPQTETSELQQQPKQLKHEEKDNEEEGGERRRTMKSSSGTTNGISGEDQHQPVGDSALCSGTTTTTASTDGKTAGGATTEKANGSGAVYVMALPPMGESITEGNVLRWNKEVGEMVQADEVVCVIETDKVTVDIHSDVQGVVKSLGAPEGGVVLVGGRLITLDTDGFPSVPPSGKSGFRPVLLSAERGGGGGCGTGGAARSGRKSSIKFGRKHKGAEERTNGRVDGGIERQPERFYSDYSDVPAELKPKGLSAAEIEFINSGGADAFPGSMGGQWSTRIVFTPTPPPKKKAAVVVGGGGGKKDA
eukprot:GHVS01029808.1.p1 GENE.GHVS01029808.1~~GHVS01029808.1.p1  ORF type:complete len:572 (-),score=157.02 GHVS01029808.1:116-1831(-)